MATRSRQLNARSASAGDTTEIDAASFKRAFDEAVANIELVIKGKTDIVRLAMIAILCEGHILFEDLPGTGKSMLSRALSDTIGASSARIQCTPDMLPGDITGSSIYDAKNGVFEFQPGPVFTNILLADEINRATPKTQSALLEAMAERRVSADGTTYDLPRPFLVLATQNPVEQAGTFPLPEAQLDRFLFKLSMGYMDRTAEFEVMFDNSVDLAINRMQTVMTPEIVQDMIAYASTVEVSPEVGYYIVDIVQATRDDAAIAAGGSPRATISLIKAARVLAATDGRSHVYPDDVRAVLKPVLGHRIILNPDAILRGETADSALERVVGTVKPPVSGADLRSVSA